MDSSSSKKQKVSLGDYPFKQDLENRLLMARFTLLDLRVLEEILYSSIRIPLKKLAESVDLHEDALLPILVKLSCTGLLAFEEEAIVVDKEARKYFEGQILRFDPDFKPGIEFLQTLLKNIPIHVLPLWYSLPRLSNHIFESIVEKYLQTPQVFQRYLADLIFLDPRLGLIVKEVYSSPDLKVEGKKLREQLQLTREQFEELLVQLEFHFVCFLSYEKRGDQYEDVISALHEWREYQAFLRATLPTPFSVTKEFRRKRPHDFSFVEDLSTLLKEAKRGPLAFDEAKLLEKLGGLQATDPLALSYLKKLTDKLCHLRLASLSGGVLSALSGAEDFLALTQEERALFLYRHPLSRRSLPSLPSDLPLDRALREAEKSLVRVLTAGWVSFDDFIRGVLASFNERSFPALKKQGKSWHYQLPSYSNEELAFIRGVVLEWLFEVGITAVGSDKGRECFCVTPFGQSLFGH